jgi:hypothetical protein
MIDGALPPCKKRNVTIDNESVTCKMNVKYVKIIVFIIKNLDKLN